MVAGLVWELELAVLVLVLVHQACRCHSSGHESTLRPCPCTTYDLGSRTNSSHTQQMICNFWSNTKTQLALAEVLGELAGVLQVLVFH